MGVKLVIWVGGDPHLVVPGGRDSIERGRSATKVFEIKPGVHWRGIVAVVAPDAALPAPVMFGIVALYGKPPQDPGWWPDHPRLG